MVSYFTVGCNTFHNHCVLKAVFVPLSDFKDTHPEHKSPHFLPAQSRCWETLEFHNIMTQNVGCGN